MKSEASEKNIEANERNKVLKKKTTGKGGNKEASRQKGGKRVPQEAESTKTKAKRKTAEKLRR